MNKWYFMVHRILGTQAIHKIYDIIYFMNSLGTEDGEGETLVKRFE